MSNALEHLRDLEKGWGEFAKVTPDVIGAFGKMRQACCAGGALDLKTFELVCVAVSVARKCEPCILSHVEVCVDQGVTREELAGALNATVLLCGGPGFAYSAFALKAFDEMKAAKKS